MKKYLLLTFAICLGLYLRLHFLASIPNGLTWDEAALGYNAYSILKTGKDEFGQFMPLIFKSFGDYKPGLYVYLTIPSVALFGLNEFGVRLPSAIFGSLAIIGIYLFVCEIFKKEKHAHLLASLSALSLAISPWHVHFSHAAWEVNVFSTLLLFGLYFFIRFIKGTSSITPTLIFACATLVTYQAAKLLTPLNYLLVAIIYWKIFWNQTILSLKRRKDLISIIIAIFFTGWVITGSMFGPAGNRLSRLSIFGYRPQLGQETIKTDNNNSLSLLLYHNQPKLTINLIISRYLFHFSPEVLFYEGSNFTERGHIPSLGVLNPLEFIWIVFGLIYLSKNWPNKSSILVILLLFFAPIPASMTLEEFSTVRALFMTVPLAIISGLGMYQLIRQSKIIFVSFLILYLLVFVYTFDVYFVHSQKVMAKEFNYGYKQAMNFINKFPNSRVVMTDVFGQPYIYYLFYSKYDPTAYQKENNFISGGVDVGFVGRVGRAEFHQFSDQDILTQKDTVFVGTVGNINNQFSPANSVVEEYETVNYPNGSPVFRMIKTRK